MKRRWMEKKPWLHRLIVKKRRRRQIRGGETKTGPNQLKQTSNPSAEVRHRHANKIETAALNGYEDKDWDIYPESESTAASVGTLRDPTAHVCGLEEPAVTSGNQTFHYTSLHPVV